VGHTVAFPDPSKAAIAAAPSTIESGRARPLTETGSRHAATEVSHVDAVVSEFPEAFELLPDCPSAGSLPEPDPCELLALVAPTIEPPEIVMHSPSSPQKVSDAAVLLPEQAVALGPVHPSFGIVNPKS
jgi:hypothetical protein